MKTTIETNKWGIRSASYWMAMFIVLGIIFIGVRFILNPIPSAADFGLPFSNVHDITFGRIKGIRDIFSGLAILPFLILKMPKAAAWVFTIAIIIPITDCLIVLTTNGPADIQHLLVHGLTALYMAITGTLLFRAAN